MLQSARAQRPRVRGACPRGGSPSTSRSPTNSPPANAARYEPATTDGISVRSCSVTTGRPPCARVRARGGDTTWRGRRRSGRRSVASCADHRRARRGRRATFRSSVTTVRRPPSRPRARAAFKPACVRSRISWRSNSAIAPKMWNTSRPEEAVVSMPSVRLGCETRAAGARARRSTR
jgi:hypothetical protein